jgi:hypothetical protein
VGKGQKLAVLQEKFAHGVWLRRKAHGGLDNYPMMRTSYNIIPDR